MIHAVAVVGPTGSGKTALGVEIAERLGTEIISADSMQCYRGMSIGTGAPSADELARVKHHFVGCYELSERMSAADFAERARAVVARLNERELPAVVVGGSGLYIQALLDGLFQGPGADPDIRARLEEEAAEEGADSLYRLLQSVDPEYARKIEPSDLRRTVRGLEVYELTGKPLSELHQEQPGGGELKSIQFALEYPRDVLYNRINRRVDAMLKAGLLDEIRGLLDQGHGEELDRIKSLGYRELVKHLREELPYDEAVELMKMYTRRYAKRQLTWFRSDSRINWIDVNSFETFKSQVEHAMNTLSEELTLTD